MIKDYAKHLDTLVENAGIITFGNQQQTTPVVSAKWPENMEPTSSVNDQVIVTQGETKPLGEPREDEIAQNNMTGQNDDVMGEVASLLITIGYILNNAKIVNDKFDTNGVLKYLNDTFGKINTSTPAIVTSVEVPPEGIVEPQDYMESRKLMESRLRNIKK